MWQYLIQHQMKTHENDKVLLETIRAIYKDELSSHKVTIKQNHKFKYEINKLMMRQVICRNWRANQVLDIHRFNWTTNGKLLQLSLKI